MLGSTITIDGTRSIVFLFERNNRVLVLERFANMYSLRFKRRRHINLRSKRSVAELKLPSAYSLDLFNR